MNKMKMLTSLLFCFLLVGSLMAENKSTPASKDEGFVWKADIPADCPFERSPSLTGVRFTGRHSDYTCGDTWYPSWASDGNLYSPWTDGRIKNERSAKDKSCFSSTPSSPIIVMISLKILITPAFTAACSRPTSLVILAIRSPVGFL